MTKAASFSLRAFLHTPRLLPFLLLFAALLLAAAQFFAHDPDSGSGFGGTGRLGGESGLGGTGGPATLGLDDGERETEDEDLRNIDAQALMALASARIDVEDLRLSPEPAPAAPSVAATAPAPRPLPTPASAPDAPTIPAVIPEPALALAASLPTLQAAPPGIAPPLPANLAPTLELDVEGAASAAIDANLASTRQLLLAEADLAMASEAVAIDVLPDPGAERLRLSLPVRPERPDRPTLQAPRISAPPRGIPTPPVRPMRL